MSKKRILAVVIASMLVLGIAGAVWAAATNTTPSARSAAQTKLSEAQRKEIIGLQKQILEVQKQIVKKQVEYKLLTPAQGKAAEANLDVMAERLDSWDGTMPGPGLGMGMGFRGGRGLGGFGPGGGRMGRGWGGQGQPGTCPYFGATNNSQTTQ